MQLLQSTSENSESKISTSDLKLQSFKLTQSVCTKKVNMQGGHSPGKPGKVREFQSGQGKVKETEICLLDFERAEELKLQLLAACGPELSICSSLTLL